MSGPLGDAARRRLTETAASRLAARGFDVSRPGTRAEPPAIAVDERETLGIEPLTAADATPTTIASRLGHALDRGRRVLFVVEDPDVASTAREILTDPPLLVAETDGRRTFHAGPDRVPVDTGGLASDTGGYACVRVDDLGASNGSVASDPAFRWRETDTPVGPVPAVAGVDAGATGPNGRPAVPRLLCEVGSQVVAVLAGVESLQTPPAEAFPYFYRRDPTDKRFRVRRGDTGAVVETVSGFAPMRAAGFVPVPMPLVPEHVLGPDAAVAGAWDLIVADDAPGTGEADTAEFDRTDR